MIVLMSTFCQEKIRQAHLQDITDYVHFSL